ncbi:MAG TPA: hypothetical protein VHS05_29075, partial [Pyrinomonadaceae bacterium]|nr:hypothetical protein [Pyrinomonadaceae bacterium]
MIKITRRSFLRSTSTAVVGGAILGRLSAQEISEPPVWSRISAWEYRRGSLGGPWEAWRKANDDANVWTRVQLPHCFNAYDSVDPDVPYYQGPGWYRTRITQANPYRDGRTLLHFEGAGQKTEVFVHTERVGSHVGGYDEFMVDITEQAKKFPAKESIPIAVMCDNSRDLEMIPSNLSDFNLNGGLYRYVNLLYCPAISLERVHIDTELQPNGKGRVMIKGRLYNPGQLKDELEINISVTDPNEHEIHSVTRKLSPWLETQNLATFTIDKPALWSPQKPSLYRCEVTLK